LWVQFNEVDKARKALAKLRQDFGDRVEVLGIEGWFALGTGDFATAEQKLAAAFKKKPDSELLILTTRAQWAQKNQESALKNMRDWLKDHPNDVPVNLQLAEAYMSIGKDDDAIAAYKQVVKIVPSHVPALNNLAWLSREKAPKQAMVYAQQAYQLAPKDPIVIDTLAMLTLKNGDLSLAVGLLRDAAARAPENQQIQVHLATALIKQKRLSEAQTILKKVVGKGSNTPSAQEARRLLDSLGKR
jgi:cellulose synthase operon protein C